MLSCGGFFSWVFRRFADGDEKPSVQELGETGFALFISSPPFFEGTFRISVIAIHLLLYDIYSLRPRYTQKHTKKCQTCAKQSNEEGKRCSQNRQTSKQASNTLKLHQLMVLYHCNLGR